MTKPELHIRPATFPADLSEVRDLFEEYAAELGVDLCFQGFADELAGLSGKYSPPAGGLWLPISDGAVVGCVALRQHTEFECEMKRLYVRPTFRGTGLGRVLVERVLAEAARTGYRRILLDTLPTIAWAIQLYRSLGFVEVPPYCHNPVPGALFLGRGLGDINPAV